MSAVAEKEPAVKTADASAAAPAPVAAAGGAAGAAGASSASEHGAIGEAKVEVKAPAGSAPVPAAAGESKDDTLDVVIIGGGPAGYSAGLYTSVYRLKHVLYEGTEAGGQLMKTTYVENFPGVGRVNGFDLAYGLDKSIRDRQRNADGAVSVDVAVAGSKKPKKANLVTGYRADAEDMGVPIVTENVTRIQPLASKPPTYRVHFGEEGKSVVTKTIILATGATPVHLEFPNKTKFFNLMSCAVCDGRHPHFKNKPLAIVGGGDAAMEGALFLAKTSNPVYLINRTQHFKASAYMLAKAKAEPNIKFVLDAVVEDVAGPAVPEDQDPALDTITIKPKVGEKYNLAVSGLFFAIGHKPASSLLKGIADLHEDGYVKILPETDTATSLPGVHAAGDVADSKYRQAAVSVGHGVMAAYNVNRYINML